MNKILFLILISFFSVSFANSAKIQKHPLNIQESILLACLNVNFDALSINTNDYSSDNYPYHTKIKIIDFVKKEAGEFHKERYAIKTENGIPPNMIFQRCANFSKSSKVKRFLKTLDLHICNPKSKHKGC